MSLTVNESLRRKQKDPLLEFIFFQREQAVATSLGKVTSEYFISNYWMTLSRIWRILQIEKEAIHRGRRRSSEFFISYESRIQ